MTVLEAIKRMVAYLAAFFLFVACHTLIQPLGKWLQTEWHWQIYSALGVTLHLTCLLWVCLFVLLGISYFYVFEGLFSKSKGID